MKNNYISISYIILWNLQWGITCAHAGNDLIDISDITSSKSLMVAQVLDLGHGSESGISTGSNIEKPVFQYLIP